MGKPDFIDNRDGNTLATALCDALGGSASPPDEVRVATAYFSPTGFSRISDFLKPVSEVRLMLGADPAAVSSDEEKDLEETTKMYEQRLLTNGLHRMDDTLRRDRDHLPFTKASGAALRKLISALKAGNMHVRRYEDTFLHAKAYIFTPTDGESNKPEGMIAGSSNLTGAGLTSNLELNLGRYDRPIVERGRKWFDDLWEEAQPYDLAKVFEEAFQPRTPWELFIRVLWQLYGDEVEKDLENDQNLPLTPFQKHGVARALRLINGTGGAIVADEVGLGKTFIAGEVLQIYRERRQRALLLCPASLRDTTWRKFLTRYQLFVECLSFEELASDKQLRDARRPKADQEKLQRPIEEYQLVVVDEAHNYRNPDAPMRYCALERLLFGHRRDVLFLTATPVNNSLWDLYHLLRLFVRQDSHFANLGIQSIRDRFVSAMKEDPSDLSPDILYPIIDATTVKRTRLFVKTHYEGDTIVNQDGIKVPIVFPKPEAISVRYKLDDLLPGFFDELESALDPDSGESISFARYMPQVFLKSETDTEEDARLRAMVGLLRSGILKRFESSAYAFRRTVSKMAHEHDTFLSALDEGFVVSTDFMKELSADDTAFDEILADSDNKMDSSDFDVERLREAVERDRDLLMELAQEAEKITHNIDPKLRVLSDTLVEIAEKAKAEATDSIHEAQLRKVLVFSYFEDTAEWVRDFLKSELSSRPELAGYLKRMEVVSGSGDLGEQSRQRAVQGFAPKSMEAPAGHDDDLYDLLISTDVLAEGVNLQQCRHIINYDMPWNPMRLVQRHGRIDRIGSPYNRVFMRTIFPVDRLDQLLNLEQRILDKLAMAAASVGVAAPIQGASEGSQVFTESREEIEKLLKDNDASIFERGGTAGAAQTGEEYRQTLRKALAQNKSGIVNLPWKTGSGMVKGNQRGVFFCAVVGDRTFLRFVPANEEWEVSEEEDSILHEMGTCLRLIECSTETPTWCPEDLQERVYDFWEAAQNHIHSEWSIQTDPQNLQKPVPRLNREVAEFIRSHIPQDMEQERLHRALDILESDWPYREKAMLKDWFQDQELDGPANVKLLVENILDTGLEPIEPPQVLPPIELEDIKLLCWLGIDSESELSSV